MLHVEQQVVSEKNTVIYNALTVVRLFDVVQWASEVIPGEYHPVSVAHIRSAKQDDNYGASNIILPCPGS